MRSLITRYATSPLTYIRVSGWASRTRLTRVNPSDTTRSFGCDRQQRWHYTVDRARFNAWDRIRRHIDRGFRRSPWSCIVQQQVRARCATMWRWMGYVVWIRAALPLGITPFTAFETSANKCYKENIKRYSRRSVNVWYINRRIIKTNRTWTWLTVVYFDVAYKLCYISKGLIMKEDAVGRDRNRSLTLIGQRSKYECYMKDPLTTVLKSIIC